ncbi:hydrolase [Lachnoclostridium pacaense]|uniref:XkdQ/YqbQ family protein n=1 Tax=Enterocloster TaxID=2719313 RepID=UPI001D06DC83|nr:hydrolase [Lachnoclostridium pacaense]MCB7335975.1 hydrolase [Enterocloster aldenensis]MCC2879966.1 hydrolase [Lachnoclostridium pacaense]DAQ87561.1 MAG TPA: 43 kDa tail protein [Caudoviricetes sp.]
MNVHVYIQNGQAVYEPVVEGSVTWDTARKGQPGKCSFTVIPDGKLEIEEGNAVRLDVNGKPVFFGFIFERNWSSDGEVKVTAYDQLRYLKNKDSYSYEDRTAGEVIQMIAGDFNLRTGVLDDTGYKIPYRNEPDTTLFDIILNALDLTMMATGKMYVLYDDVGKLALRNVEDMKLDIMIDDGTAQDYDFTISIDKDTYNQIKLYRDNDDTKKRDVFMTRHTENINKWGVLQMSESLDKGVDGQKIAETYLGLYNRPTRSLSVKGAFGDIKVRAGCLIPVFLDVKDMQLKNYLLVESVTHKIDEGIHTMDLALRGAGING